MMWHTVLQDASFKGINFDVMNIEESDGKTLVEHAKPFTNGTMLEDMGTTGRHIQVSAVFWGKQYHSRLNELIEALMESGSGVLIHPVWGRMTNMIAESWHFRHEADYVDYATLDITFRESGDPQKIFVFENQFLMALEELIAKIDRYRAYLEGLIDSLMMGKQGTSALFGSLFGLWSAACGTFESIRSMFDLDSLRFGARGDFQASTFHQNIKTLHVDLSNMIRQGCLQIANISDTGDVYTQDSRTPRQRFEAVAREVDSVSNVPSQVFAWMSDGDQTAQTRLQRVTWSQVQMVENMVKWSSLSVVFQVAYLIIEEYGDTMTAPDLMAINRAVRLRIYNEIAVLRELLQQAQSQQDKDSNSYGYTLYESTYSTIESLRTVADGLNHLVIAAINQKPPLVVRPAPLSGTMQQIAFAFYGDFSRSDELIRLNPHITHPNFIRQGQYINGYTK